MLYSCTHMATVGVKGLITDDMDKKSTIRVLFGDTQKY